MIVLGPDYVWPKKSNDFDPSWLDFSLKMWSKNGLGQRAPPSNHWFFLRNNDKSWKWPHLAMLKPVFHDKCFFYAKDQCWPMKSTDCDPSWLDFPLKMCPESGLIQMAPPVTIGFSLEIMTNPENDHIWLCLNPFSLMNACLCPQIAFV